MSHLKTSRTDLLNYLLTYLLTPWSSVLLEKLTGSQLVKNSVHFMGPNHKFLEVSK